MTARRVLARALTLAILSTPALAQITVLDQAQDAAGQAPAPVPEIVVPRPPAPCGTLPLSLAHASWPSATLLAEIHARILTAEFGCEVRVTPGDLGATASSMGSTGQPAVAPEMWVTRIADVWNAGMDAQMLRPAAPTYAETQFEGWFVPDYVAVAHPELIAAAGLVATLPTISGAERVRFISCPVDWACALINRNLISALGLTSMVDLVEPANRFEMDT